MFALYKLQAKVWFANFFNKIDFFMVILFLSVMGSMAAAKLGGASADPIALSIANINIVSSITLMMIASSSINTFGMSFFEMKESVLLKRIGATEITKPKAIGSFMLWGMTSMIMIIGWMFLLIGLCQIPSSPKTLGGLLWISGDVWATIDWSGVFLSMIITMLAFYAIAFFFVSISKDVTGYQMMGTFYFFIVAMLGGSFTPNADREWMNIIGFLSPLGWGGDLMSSSISGQEWWNIVEGFDAISIPSPVGDVVLAESATGWKVAGNIFMPIIYGTLAGLASAKFFKWD